MDFTDVLPDISVTKTADVASVPETGGDVTYTFVVTNNGAESVTLTSLVDDIFGDISAECGLPQVIAAGGSYTCAITRTISGDCPGQPRTNTVTATAEDDDGNTDTAQATETVDFTDVGPDISLTKTADLPQRPRDRRRGHLHLCRNQQRRGGGGLRRPHRRYVRGHLR